MRAQAQERKLQDAHETCGQGSTASCAGRRAIKRFGYYVRLGGDKEISEALDRGVRGAMLPAPRENNEACRRVAMWQHTSEEWARMTRDARRRYRRNRRPQGIGKALLIGYALACLGVSAGFRWMCGLAEGRLRRWH